MGFPIPQFNKVVAPSKYLIEIPNRIDFQTVLECSAFSCAYLLRHFGQDVEGLTVYENMPNKMKNGSVYPKGIINYLNSRGLHVQYCKGSVAQLKNEIAKGTPVIVFIKVFPNKKYYHYVPIVGYDDTYFYLAESLKDLVNIQTKSNIYNRKISVAELKKLWALNNLRMPIYSNTYFITSSK